MTELMSKARWILFLLVGLGMVPSALSGQAPTGSPPAFDDVPEWRIESEPAVSIGMIEGADPYVFGAITAAVLRSDGSVVVADGQAQEIRAFDPGGRHLWTAGGPGDGPGEFRGLQALAPLAGDSVASWDVPSRRLTIWAPDGSFVRDHAVRVEGFHSSGDLEYVGNGRFVLTTQPSLVVGQNQPGSVIRPEVEVVVLSTEGELLETLGTFPSNEFAFYTVEGRNWSSPPPFARDISVAAGNGKIYVGTQDRLGYDVYDSSGAMEEAVHVADLDLQIDDDLKNEFWDRRRKAAERGERFNEGQFEDRIRNIPYPSTRAAFDALLVDEAGNVWLKAAAGPGNLDPHHWWIVDGQGSPLGWIELPAGFELTSVDRGSLVGVWTDEFDVEYVRVYRLSRGGAPLDT